MGSKGSKVTTQSNQTTAPDPRVQQAGYQALSGAQSAAQAPFQMPQAPVAPFNNMQNQYFNQLGELQGMAQPYFDQASQYMQGSAAPITGQDVSQYYNPMAQNVFANLQDVFGQQMHQTTGNAVQRAGGTSADRIGVTQANLAKQQGLAAGQTAASLYQPALAAAQQQKQMMAGAGFGLGQLGPAAQSAFLQGTGALGQGGAQQQALQQQQLNAQYQQQLAQIAYPFQTPQYLAGIVGGMGPTMGGTSQGQSQTTYPQPSPFAQIAGIGTAALGAYMGMPGLGMGGQKGATYGAPSGSWGSYGGVPYPTFRRGGAIRLDSGGSAYGDLAAQIFRNSPVGNPYASDDSASDSDQNYASGGDVPPPLPGSAPPPLDTTSIVPKIPLTGGGGNFPKLDLRHQPLKQAQSPGGDVADAITKTAKVMSDARGGAVNPFDHFQPMQEGGDPGESWEPPIGPELETRPSASEIVSRAGSFWPKKTSEAVESLNKKPETTFGDAIFGSGAQAAPAANPFAKDFPYETAGGQNPSSEDVRMPQARPIEARLVDPSAELPDVYRGGHETLNKRYGPQVASAIMGNFGVESPGLDPRESHDEGTGIGIAGWRNERKAALYDFAKQSGRDPHDRRTQLDFLSHELESPEYRGMVARMQAAKSPAEAAQIFRTEFERPAGTTQGRPLGMGRAADLAGKFHSGDFSDVGGTTEMLGKQRGPSGPFTPLANRDMTLDSVLRNPNRPYPDATQRDWGQKLTRSPWMSLVDAGAKMAQTTGPIGSVIGAGIGAGSKSLQGQRQELQNEEQMNQKADALFQHAKAHLDTYQRMTPYEKSTSDWRQTKLETPTGAAGWKYKAWLSANPGDEKGALEFAGGRRQVPEPQLRRWAADQALKEKKDDPSVDIDKRTRELLDYYKESSGTTAKIGEKKVFKDRAGNDVTGVWDGTEWKPETT